MKPSVAVERLARQVERRDMQIAALKKTVAQQRDRIAGMVCGSCLGAKVVLVYGNPTPCPRCRP